MATTFYYPTPLVLFHSSPPCKDSTSTTPQTMIRVKTRHSTVIEAFTHSVSEQKISTRGSWSSGEGSICRYGQVLGHEADNLLMFVLDSSFLSISGAAIAM